METNAAPSQEMHDMHILVIGAGATGLLIAHGLKKAGIQCTVFEAEHAETSNRVREWTMGIHWGLPLLESMLPESMRSQLQERTFTDPHLDWDQSPSDKMRLFNGLTGGILRDIDIKGKLVRVSRRRLRMFLAEGLDVKYGHVLTDITYSSNGQEVTARFSNGTTCIGTLLVGCDGPRSAVRMELLGPEHGASHSLDNVIHSNVTYCPGDAARARFLRTSHPAFAIAHHPELFAFNAWQDIPDPSMPETWVIQVVCGWLGERTDFPTAESRMAEVKRKGAMLCEPFASAIAWIPEDTRITFDQINYWRSEAWDTHNGRVTLAGDAAHPMPPHRGQGLNHAIQDAYNLVQILTRHAKESMDQNDNSTVQKANLAVAIQDFSDEVAERGAAEVDMSTQNALMTCNWETLMQAPMFKHALDKSPNLGKRGQETNGSKNDVAKEVDNDHPGEDSAGHLRRLHGGKTGEMDDGEATVTEIIGTADGPNGRAEDASGKDGALNICAPGCVATTRDAGSDGIPDGGTDVIAGAEAMKSENRAGYIAAPETAIGGVTIEDGMIGADKQHVTLEGIGINRDLCIQG